jgi:GMP synthase-like glutamine amidotransferase
MRIHILIHAPFETAGAIYTWMTQRGHAYTQTHLYAPEARLPSPQDVDMLIVMGGPMSIYDEDEYPWLTQEKAFLRACIAQKKTILGICLGGQLLADSLGATITKNPHREIGWFPITLTPQSQQHPLLQGIPSTFEAQHWHGETFAIPHGAIALGSSQGCHNQGFIYHERILALQCHLEIRTEDMRGFVKEAADELLDDSPFIQSIPEIQGQPHQYYCVHARLYQLLDNLSRTVTASV